MPDRYFLRGGQNRIRELPRRGPDGLHPRDGQHLLLVVQPGEHREDDASLPPLDRVSAAHTRAVPGI